MKMLAAAALLLPCIVQAETFLSTAACESEHGSNQLLWCVVTVTGDLDAKLNRDYQTLIKCWRRKPRTYALIKPLRATQRTWLTQVGNDCKLVDSAVIAAEKPRPKDHHPDDYYPYAKVYCMQEAMRQRMAYFADLMRRSNCN